MPLLKLILINYLGSCVIFNLNFLTLRNVPVVFKLTLLLISLLVLQACATKPIVNQNINKVEQINQWQARGKLLVKNGKEKMSGYFFWQQYNSEEFKLVITSFIGTNVLTLEHKLGNSQLQIDGKTYNGSKPEHLIARLTGNYIPVTYLANWMLAKSPPSAKTNYINDSLTRFEHLDKANALWTVKYQNYQAVGQVSLPQNMTVKGLNSSIKLSINNWDLF